MFIDAVISALAQKSFNSTWSKARKKDKGKRRDNYGVEKKESKSQVGKKNSQGQIQDKKLN